MDMRRSEVVSCRHPRSTMLCQLLRKPRQAILAVNINDQHDLRGAFDAAHLAQTPVILMASVRAIEHSGLSNIFSLFDSERKNCSVPTWLQLDHAADTALIQSCIELGFDIVMADFSSAPVEENVRNTRHVVDAAHASHVLVEGEVSPIPDDLAAAQRGTCCTVPAAARDFAARTGVDLLAVSVGNMHGFARQKPPLDFGLIRSISGVVSTPLVLHGADYCSAAELAGAVSAGIAKINIGPELREAYCLALRSAIERCDWHAPDQRIAMNIARQAVRDAMFDRLANLTAGENVHPDRRLSTNDRASSPCDD
jgi:tagatose 1,6-diphosphate aldolase GatY/KbaY